MAMATNNKGKNILIDLSSSSSDDNADEDDFCFVSLSSSSSSSSGDECSSIDEEDEERDDDDDVYEVDDEESEEVEEERDSFDDDDASLSNRVISFLQGRRDLQTLSLKACKSYLRRHGLRVSGNKNECVHRVQEHWRIKDGKAELLYPRSSFAINCTGDVCKGDVVLFKQKVYGSFVKLTRNGKLLGKRTVAGQVVKESYGSAKQQHTFTVEVLWSKGIKKLPPLFPLLVKGRNLYRLKTYRQMWKDEGERRKVLAEKHRRGTVARCNRAKRMNALSTNKGRKSRKVSHSRRSFEMDYPKGHRPFGTEKGASSSTSNPVLRPQKQGLWDNRLSSLHSFHGASQRYHELPVRPHYSSAPFGSHSADIQGEIIYHGQLMMPAAQNGVSSRSSFCNFNGTHSPWVRRKDSMQFLPSKSVHRQWKNSLLYCSIQGYSEPGSSECVIAACWRCCRRVRMGCNVHR